MKICLCYIAVANGHLTDDFAVRFTSTYHACPPGYDHDTLVICNGGPLSTSQSVLFAGMNAKFWPRANDAGWDITAYLAAAKGPCKDYDMMLCLGESNYFHRPGWLLRFVEAWRKHGEGVYGPYGTNVVRAHLQTTAFACSPARLRDYPLRVADRKGRYEFEHGERSLWRRAAKHGKPVMLVTWDGEWSPRQWRSPENIIWRGDQSNCLMWCNHSDGFSDADQSRRASWARSADRTFK